MDKAREHYRLTAAADRNELKARIAREDVAKYERWIATNSNGFGPVNADVLRAEIAQAEKAASRHEKAAAKARGALAAL